MTQTAESLQQEIQQEIADNKILIYSKGTKQEPKCGFTVETFQFFEQFGYPYTMIDVLDNMEKRDVLSQMTNWPTLPKVFINGKFYGDTDILEPMAAKGELKTLLEDTFKE